MICTLFINYFLFTYYFTFYLLFSINLIHSCIKSENSNASVSTSHQILAHFAVLLTSRYGTKLSRDEINWFLMSKKSN